MKKKRRRRIATHGSGKCEKMVTKSIEANLARMAKLLPFIFVDYVKAQKAAQEEAQEAAGVPLPEIVPKIPICHHCYFEGKGGYGCNNCGLKKNNTDKVKEIATFLKWCPVCTPKNEINLECEICKGKCTTRRRMAIREFSSRRDSPVLVRLLEEIVAANRRA